MRFPEFEGEWVEKKLGEVATFINGRAYKQEELLSEGTYPVLRVGNFFSNGSWYYSDLELASDKYCDDGDLLYAWSASFGPKIWFGGKTIYHYHIWKVLPAEYVDKNFLFHVLDDQTLKMKTNSSNGFALLHITKGTIENWRVLYPANPEQYKIASFLSLVDERISTQNKIIEELKSLKSALSKQIFSQQLKFKDEHGKYFPEWEEKRLGDIAPLQRGFDLPVDIIKHGEFPVVFSNGILKHHSEYKVVGPGVVTGRSGTIGQVTYVERNYWPHNTSLWVTDFKMNDVKFIYYFYSNYSLERFSTGSGVPTLNRNDIHAQKEFVAVCIEEQTKIANFLSQMDEKIELELSLLTKFEEQKKYLLKAMFI